MQFLPSSSELVIDAEISKKIIRIIFSGSKTDAAKQVMKLSLINPAYSLITFTADDSPQYGKKIFSIEFKVLSRFEKLFHTIPVLTPVQIHNIKCKKS